MQGFEGDSFGTYKFITNDPNTTNGGYEFGFDRTFNLGAAERPQALNTEFFSNDSLLSFTAWADVNAGGQFATEDFDKDGVLNGIEHFMGETGSSFTPNQQAVAGVVTWPLGPYVDPNSFKIWTSENLSTWNDDTGSGDTSDPASVKFTIPTATPKLFFRLEVTTLDSNPFPDAPPKGGGSDAAALNFFKDHPRRTAPSDPEHEKALETKAFH